MVGEGGVEGHAEVMVDGRREIPGGHRALVDFTAIPGGGTDDLPVSEAAASHDHRHDHRPVVAAVGAALGAQLRGPAELAHGDDQTLPPEIETDPLSDRFPRCPRPSILIRIAEGQTAAIA